MSRFQFERPSRAEAEAFLEWRRKESMYQAEMYHDAIECQRAMLDVTTPEERAEVKRFLDIKNSTGAVNA